MIEQISINRIYGLAFVPGDFLNQEQKTAGIPEDVYHLVVELRSEYKRLFPQGHFSSKASTFGGPAILLILAGAGKSDWTNGIIDNDKMYHQMWLEDFSGGKLSVKCTVGGSFVVPGVVKYPPTKEKIGWAKKTGDCDAIYTHMARYFQKMKDASDKYNLGGQNA